MGYETSNFGSADGSNVEQTVSNHYGERNLGGATGVFRTAGSDNELTVYLTGEILAGDFLPEVVIPAGAVVTKATAHVTEAFSLEGTTPDIYIGTAGSEGTNGATLAEASAESTGYYDITSTLAGTWDEAAFAADTTVGVALDGTTGDEAITDSTVGRVVFVITYANVV